MTRRFCLAAAVVAVLGVNPALAQFDLPGARPAAPSRTLEDPKPVYKYELKPENGEFLVVVRTFLGEAPGDRKPKELDRRPKELAEGLAEWIRSECRLYAFVHERGWSMRREQAKEKEAVIKAIRDYYVPRGESEELIAQRIKREVRFAQIPDEYAVLVAPGKGSLKSLDDAIEFSKYVHKLPCPPADFCDAIVIGSTVDVARRKGDLQNPFPRAFAGRNPTLPKKETAFERPKADDFLMSLNAGQPYSLIHKTKKQFTLVVQSFGTKNGVGQLVKPGEVVQTTGRAGGEMLERAAQQANSLAKMLREMKPSFDAYVLHTRYESFVCIGEYDTKDDARLVATAEAINKLPLKDNRTGEFLKLFMEQPIPAMIPRP